MMDGHSSNAKELFTGIDRILHRKKELPLPRHSTPKEFAESFGFYFTSKIAKIRTELDAHNDAVEVCHTAVKPCPGPTLWTVLTPVATSNVLRLINKPAPQSCGLDPIPTSVVKDDAVTLAPLLTNIVNLSLTSGEVPTGLKRALVTPLLKRKPNLDTSILKLYRPVSNMHYVSKILEKVVAMQLSHHLQENNLFEPSSVCLPHCS